MKIYDAIVIGSGAAGFNCIDTLYDNGVKNILLITEGINCGTSRNTGSDKQTYYKISLSGDSPDSVTSLAETLYEGGSVDGDIALLEASNSLYSFFKLVNIGVNFPKNEFGEYVGYKTDHDPYNRASSVGPYTSKYMTEALEKSVLKKQISIKDDFKVLKILKNSENRVFGVIGIDYHSLDKEDYGIQIIYSNNVILATGGPAVVYKDSVYPLGHTGSSSLALNAGAVMSNLAEWQFGIASTKFRWNLSGTYQQVLPKYIVIDKNMNEKELFDEYYIDKYEALDNEFLKGYQWPFDSKKIEGSSFIDIIIYIETKIKGNKVFLDYRSNPTIIDEKGFDGLSDTTKNFLKNSNALIGKPIDRLKIMNPKAVSLYLEHGIDLNNEMLEIAVSSQHNNGGIDVDMNWETSVKGLYAIGECASTFGITRPGGTALNSTQVGGLRASRNIAFYSKDKVSIDENIAKEEKDKIIDFVNRLKSNVCTTHLFKEEMQNEMSDSFGFLKHIPKMEKSLDFFIEKYNSFESLNKWQSHQEIKDIFINLDMIEMQIAIAKSFIYQSLNIGSRGSSITIKSGNILDLNIKEENIEYRKKKVLIKREGNSFNISERQVRAIPDRNLWFENVWNEYNKNELKK